MMMVSSVFLAGLKIAKNSAEVLGREGVLRWEDALGRVDVLGREDVLGQEEMLGKAEELGTLELGAGRVVELEGMRRVADRAAAAAGREEAEAARR